MSEISRDVLTTGGAVDLHDSEQRKQVEAAMREVEGIIAVRLVPGYERPVDEAHVIVRVDRNPKHVVRDLQSVLMASFDVPTDHRVFSVVQLEDESVVESGSPRIVLTKTAVITRGNSVEIEVEVAGEEGHLVTTSATGGPGETSRGRSAAEAALAAVVEVSDGKLSAELESAEVVELPNVTVALSVIRVRGWSGTTIVTGSAPVRADVVDAVVRATLDATNRVLALRID